MSGRLVFYGLFIFQIILGLCTVHIVYHWDENKLIDAVIRQYSQGSLLPEWYNYPSLIFYISYLDYFIWDCLLKRWISDFHIFNRSVFFIISQLRAFFIFNMFKERSKPWLGILACLIFFASWEYHYHSRWVAPDTIAATLGFIAVYLGWKNKSWASALFAGLAFGTKYTAGIFLIPLFIFFFNANWKVTAKNYLIILLCFIATFIITTPGILLEWNKAMADILWEKQHYATGHHVYTIGNGMDHLTRNLIYITAVLPSRQLILGAITTVFSAIGLIYLIRKKKYKLILLIAVFIFYLIYLSTQKVMFVRNLMIIWPMLVILITLGMKFILDKFKSDFYIGIPFALLITTSMLLVIKSDYSIIYRETSKPLYLLN